MNREQQLKLQAFLDGELPEREAREILAGTQRDHDAAALLTELRNTRQAVVKSKPQTVMPEAREFFWSKIEREICRPDPSPSVAPPTGIFGGWVRFFFPAVAGAALFIALFRHFDVPKNASETVADAGTSTVETALASAGAATFYDASEGTTLVWFSDDAPDQVKKPTALN